MRHPDPRILFTLPPLPRASSLAVFFLAALTACTRPAEQVEPVRPALVYTVSDAPDAARQVYSGEVHARHETALSFRIGGKILERHVEVGARVKRGQILGRLDPSDVHLANAAAIAQLSAARADADHAAAELVRAQNLFARKFISQSALEARLAAAEAAQGRLAAAQAQRGLSDQQVKYATLTAAADGVITALNFEPGLVVSAGQAIGRIAYEGEREVHIRLGEPQARALSPGQETRIRLWAFPGKILAGRVREIAPAADEVRTFTAKITLLQADENILPGMSASVSFAEPGKDPAILLPPGALFRTGEKSAVWRVNTALGVEAVPVEIVQFREDALLVRGNLNQGDLIVAAGAYKLHPGQTVKPVPHDPFKARP